MNHEQILEHYKNPHNFGKPEWQSTHTYKLQNLSCGDEAEVFLLVENNQIKDFRFTAEGCSISIAATSLLSNQLIGMDLQEFEKYKKEDVLKLLPIELKPSRIKCATLGFEATKKAINN